jgi:O-antigen ligase
MLSMTLPPGFDYHARFMATSGDSVSRIIWLSLLAAGTYGLVKNVPRTKVFLRWLNPFLVAFMVLATCSLLWSIDTAVTTRRLLRAFTLVATAISFAMVGWHRERFQDVLRTLMTAMMVASLIFVIIDPDDAIHHSNQAELSDAWRGITFGKNILGSFASTGLILWLHGWVAKEVRPFAALCAMALCGLMLVMTRSATSLMATVFAMIFLLLLMRPPGAMKRYMPTFVALFATLILIYAVAVLRLVPHMEILLTPITSLTGKDLTFTGRTAIWDILNESIRYHPWLGGGYGAYWVGAIPTSPSFEMLTKLYFYPSEGHNGYIDIVNDLGIVGGLVLIGYFASYIRQSIKMMRFDRAQSALYLTLLFRGFLADMSETHWFFALSADFFVMTLATTALARGLLQNQVERQVQSAHSTPAPEPAPVSSLRKMRRFS